MDRFQVLTIDPYGDTLFNHLQLEELLEEWERLTPYASSETEKAALAAVRELEEYCLEQPHRFLRFYGD